MQLVRQATSTVHRVVATRMQSNKHKRGDPLASDDAPLKRVGPLAVTKEIFKHDGITVGRVHYTAMHASLASAQHV